jgi:hypothetical protein
MKSNLRTKEELWLKAYYYKIPLNLENVQRQQVEVYSINIASNVKEFEKIHEWKISSVDISKILNFILFTFGSYSRTLSV